MEREKGTATQPCPTCGQDLITVELADGATSTVRCDKCNPVGKETASAGSDSSRERGTNVSTDDPQEEVPV